MIEVVAIFLGCQEPIFRFQFDENESITPIQLLNMVPSNHQYKRHNIDCNEYIVNSQTVNGNDIVHLNKCITPIRFLYTTKTIGFPHCYKNCKTKEQADKDDNFCIACGKAELEFSYHLK